MVYAGMWGIELVALSLWTILGSVRDCRSHQAGLLYVLTGGCGVCALSSWSISSPDEVANSTWGEVSLSDGLLSQLRVRGQVNVFEWADTSVQRQIILAKIRDTEIVTMYNAFGIR